MSLSVWLGQELACKSAGVWARMWAALWVLEWAMVMAVAWADSLVMVLVLHLAEVLAPESARKWEEALV